MSTRRGSSTQVAASIPYDPTSDPTCDLVSTNVQEAIDELCVTTSISASPGYSWGKSGAVNSGPSGWLLNEGVSSENTGRNFPLDNGELLEISVANSLTSTFDLEFYEHDGTTYTVLATVSVVSARSDTFDITDFGTVTVTQGMELAMKVSTGSGKDIVVQVILKGTK